MTIKREPFIEGEFYHICNKSIANYGILRTQTNAMRFIYLLDYYNNQQVPQRFSYHIRDNNKYDFTTLLRHHPNGYVKILNYNIMPDHYHLVVKLLVDGGISKYIGIVENSYSRYFNTKYKRKGPLWQSRLRSVRITSNELLLHILRYCDLNATTANLVKNPEDWPYSSYREYITDPRILKEYAKEVSIQDHHAYKRFVEGNKDYQKTLKKIKKLLLD